MASCEVSMESGDKQQQRKSKSKDSYGGRKRYQLFDPSVKPDLLKLCEGGVVHLALENEEEKDTSLDFEEGSENEMENLPEDNSPVNESSGSPTSRTTGLHCGSCNVIFTDLTEQRQHYTLDWHRYNVKMKLHGQNCVGEAKFYEMIDDLSSIDGSDDDEEDISAAARLLQKLDGGASQMSPKLPERLSTIQKLDKSPKVYFKNERGQVISCFKAILPSKSRQEENVESSLNSMGAFISFVEKPLRITIVMASGGHFAAAVFVGNSCVNHKTFHSYTVRAKQGGGQSSRDAKSGTSHPKSGGASLRRYNEQSFTQHVQDLLTSWKNSIADSNLIFCRAVSSNANILFGGKNPPLSKDSDKLRTIPFPTKRPTFNEVKRVHSLLTTVQVYESIDSFLDVHSHFAKNGTVNSHPKSQRKTKKVVERARSRSPKRKDDPELEIQNDAAGMSDPDDIESHNLVECEIIVDFSELKEYDDSLTSEERKNGKGQKKRSKKPKGDIAFKVEGLVGDLANYLFKRDIEALQNSLSELKQNGDIRSDNLNLPVDLQSSTLLHLAAKNSLVDVIWPLLDAGCNPSIKDKAGKYPYNYSESRECRDVFRRFMGQYPEKYDYKKAQIPPPLSEEMEKERAEKKKLLNKLKREKEKQKKMERKEIEKESEEQRRFLNLSDREKRALAAEQRILAECKRNAEKQPVLIRCFECAVDMTGKVPFEYNQNVFCTSKCLATHRKKFPCPLSV